MRLIVMRHAKSAWPDGIADFERPLAERGLRDAPAAGRWIRENGPAPEMVVCSPAVRARTTADLVTTELAAQPDTRHDERLYGEPAETVVEVLRELPAVETVLVVGHNPVLEDLVELLTGITVEMKTSTVAVLTGDRPWAEAGPGWAELDTITTPRGVSPA
ncbi:histidine phosphatase family protein [Amycolatopsis sp. YIM 10]|uniref:SixA phosphatase family protein n=1 Tax=Amycolatopsis sp. YIM 10 TaxID=2653857 RepID=UPI0012A97237|nr:histidine phosphatase family protein [Amycolatopsis sp. YIM 10]QFU87604.1 phosphohistidine phosphatase [Amycolatopsis sp. YIM 10]